MAEFLGMALAGVIVPYGRVSRYGRCHSVLMSDGRTLVSRCQMGEFLCLAGVIVADERVSNLYRLIKELSCFKYPSTHEIFFPGDLSAKHQVSDRLS